MALNQLFGNLMSSPSAKGTVSGAASGALVSMLMNPKAGKRLGKTALKVGGAAAVAGVGYMAYNQWQKSRAQAVLAQTQAPPSQAHAVAQQVSAQVYNQQMLESSARAVPANDSLCLKLLMAMIGAAASDGRIDDKEMDNLFMSMQSAALTPEESARIRAALNTPPSIQEIAAMAATPQEASEMYAAALETIDPDTPAEQMYLRQLASALQLEGSLVSHVHRAAGTLYA